MYNFWAIEEKMIASASTMCYVITLVKQINRYFLSFCYIMVLTSDKAKGGGVILFKHISFRVLEGSSCILGYFRLF